MIKPIPNFKNYYVDTEGNVYSTYRKQNRKLKPRIKKGYHFVSIRRYDGSIKFLGIHRLMLLTFKPIENPELYEVNHKNHIRDDNRLENLEWVSHTDNVRYSRKMPCKLIFDDGRIEEFSHIADMNRKYSWTVNIGFYMKRYNGYSSKHKAKIVLHESSRQNIKAKL